MNRSLLFIVTSDPRSSGRPAEAVRIAAGVGAWKNVDVTLFLAGPSVLALVEFPDELVHDDNFTRYWPIIAGFGRPVLVERGSGHLKDLGSPAVDFSEISPDELAGIAARTTYLARF